MIVRFLNRVEEGVISLLLVSTTLLIFYEVILRFVFNEGLLWAEELTLLLGGWMVLFGASYGIKVGAHIGVDFVVRKLPHKGQRIATGLAALAGIVYCAMFMIGAWEYTQQMILIQLTLEDLPVPIWMAHGVILLVGFGLLALRLLLLLWGVLRGTATGFHFADEAEESVGKLGRTKAADVEARR